MQTLKHLINTWLLAIVFFPLFFMGGTLLLNNQAHLSLLAPLLICGFIFSLPVLAVAFPLLRWIGKCAIGYEARLLLWLLALTVLILFAALLLCLLVFDLRTFFDLLQFECTAIAAAWTSVLLRFNQFMYFLHNQNKAYENDLV